MEEPARLRLVQFKRKVSEDVIYAIFTDTKDLQAQVTMSIARYLNDIRRDTLETDRGSPYLKRLGGAADLTDLVGRAVDLLRDMTKTDYNQIFLFGRVENEPGLRPIEVAYYVAAHKLRYRIASLDGLIGSVLRAGKQINADAVREWSNYLQAVVATRSELIVPIRSNGVIAGVLNSEGETEGYYTPEMCAEVKQLAEALGPVLSQVGWHPGMRLAELPHAGRALD